MTISSEIQNALAEYKSARSESDDIHANTPEAKKAKHTSYFKSTFAGAVIGLGIANAGFIVMDQAAYSNPSGPLSAQQEAHCELPLMDQYTALLKEAYTYATNEKSYDNSYAAFVFLPMLLLSMTGGIIGASASRPQESLRKTEMAKEKLTALIEDKNSVELEELTSSDYSSPAPT